MAENRYKDRRIRKLKELPLRFSKAELRDAFGWSRRDFMKIFTQDFVEGELGLPYKHFKNATNFSLFECVQLRRWLRQLDPPAPIIGQKYRHLRDDLVLVVIAVDEARCLCKVEIEGTEVEMEISFHRIQGYDYESIKIYDPQGVEKSSDGVESKNTTVNKE